MTALRLLALDTATLTASAAVVRVVPGAAPEVLAEGDASTGSGGNASERLMPLVAELMERAGVRMADLDAIAVGAGPGSFTGLRIGLATAKGLAFAAEKPLWLVSSLGALAWSMHAAGPALRVPVLDARRGEIYAGFFRLDETGVPRAVAPERVIPPADLAAAITAIAPGATDDVAVAGDGLVAHAAALASLPVNVRRMSGRATPPAVGVAALAAAGDRADGLAYGAPAYLRPAEAEVMYPDGVPGAFRKR